MSVTFMKAGEEIETILDFERSTQLKDDSVLTPFQFEFIVQSPMEIVDYSHKNFLCIQAYSQMGKTLQLVADKYDLDIKQYDKIFIPYTHDKTGFKLLSLFQVWIVGVCECDNVYNLILRIVD